MYFQSIVNAMVVMAATLTSAIIVPENIANGVWKGVQFSNGTTITTCLSDPTIPPIIEQHKVDTRTINERRGTSGGSCWNYQLDPATVDSLNHQLQTYVNNNGAGYQLCSSSDATAYVGMTENNILLYYCIDQTNVCDIIVGGMIQEGMGYMDAICAPYEAGWAIFPDPYARTIMGKSDVSTPICV
jgi:hypothetical protein